MVGDTRDAAETLPFRWPPRERTDPQPPAPIEPPRSQTQQRVTFTARAVGAIIDAARALEDFWISPTDLPLDETIAITGWKPDAPGDYCDRCASSIGPYETDEFGCASCRNRRLPWSRAIRLGEYHGDLAQFVKAIKFAGRSKLAFDLGVTLGDALRRAGLDADRASVVPMPMPAIRKFTRPCEHAAEIAAGVSHALDAPLVRALSARYRPSQRSYPASMRRQNVRGAFRLRRGVSLAGRAVVLVDDVLTTGSTMQAACRALREAGRPEIWAAPVSVASSSDRRPRDRSEKFIVERSAPRLDTL